MKSYGFLVLLAATVPVLGACEGTLGVAVTEPATAEPAELVNLPSADLMCRPKEIEFARINDHARTASGCGRQRTYMEQCAPEASGAVACSWVEMPAEEEKQPKEPRKSPI